MSEFSVRVGDAYLCTTERYYTDRVLTICGVTDERVYWHLEHRDSNNLAVINNETIHYFDAIDRQYFDRFARRSGLVIGEREEPAWEL
jgi:hypothetical protein